MSNEKDQILTFLRQHKADFQRQFGIEKIGLFGSAVRGELTGNSDIDIAIEIQSHKKICTIFSPSSAFSKPSFNARSTWELKVPSSRQFGRH